MVQLRVIGTIALSLFYMTSAGWFVVRHSKPSVSICRLFGLMMSCRARMKVSCVGSLVSDVQFWVVLVMEGCSCSGRCRSYLVMAVFVLWMHGPVTMGRMNLVFGRAVV